jgi:tetraacyldisaccharide 4'-kinase
MNKFFNKIWYSKLNLFSLALLPLTIFYYLITIVRKIFYKIGVFKTNYFNTPIIVIGNLTVGGTGKTPLCIWLCKYLQNSGIKVGIVSGGYKASSKEPMIVNSKSNSSVVGDEACLIYNETGANVVSGYNRVKATELLEKTFKNDIIIHDDGLQHLALNRFLEILLVDNNKMFGNGLLLPSGPLRESKSKINNVDILVINNSENENAPAIKSSNDSVINSITSEEITFKSFKDKTIHLVSGIASVNRIIKNLKENNILFNIHDYPDHYRFTGNEFSFNDNKPIFITSKDYVKLKKLRNKNLWIINHKVYPNDKFKSKLNNKLKEINII